uniref:ERF family protein n=1 Tax=Lactobacillus acidophilus TaxID=1579 RepID=UPI003F554E2B
MQQYGEEKMRATWAMHFAQVKAAIVQPQKKHEVTVSGTTKQGKPYKYTYKYADLADVDKAIMDAIKKTEEDGKPLLSYFFEVDNGAEGVSAETVVVDAQTGFMLKLNKVWFKNYNVGDAQQTASLISYAKRYSLSAAFGIASEDDDDAQNVQQQGAEVDDDALYAIWHAYLNHDPAATDWIHKRHDAETANKILELSNDYKKKQQSAQKAERAKALKAKRDKARNDAIKKIVDGDPENKKSESDSSSSETEGQQNLFSDILG